MTLVYDALGGPGWRKRDNWATDTPLDTWYGVTTDSEGNVTRLDLAFNGLTGSIPPELGNLQNLGSLRLGLNNLTGPIPPELGNLENLEVLALNANNRGGSNGLTGSIPPELGNPQSLDTLRLELNRLTGPVPPELGNLRNLEDLRLNLNSGLSGRLPLELVGVPLNLFHWDGTNLCAPTDDEEFLEWLASISNHRGEYCPGPLPRDLIRVP